MHSFGGLRLNSGGRSFAGWMSVKKQGCTQVLEAATVARQATILSAVLLKASSPATKSCVH